jgi:SPP1 gp7 family putative phage head morphogenesis protein
MSIPEVFFRETIDVGRYSNAVSADFVRTYNDVILLAARKLNAINIRQAKAGEGVVIAPQTKKRLRAIIAQSKSSLDKWSKTSTKKMIKEIEGLAKVQSGFIENELKKAVKSGNIPINSVAISPKYAESFVTTDPTKVNIFTSKQFTEDDFKKFGSGKFELTARQGAMQTLPNGETVEKAFRGIATRQQEGLARTIRQGVFSGESTQQIASRMIGRLEFGQRGSVRQIAQAGGEMTKLANHQIRTIVRTSVNQVQNQASQAVYAANSKVAPKYEYVATLDSRTSPICQRLDGREFSYNKGPTPPQHFNCRSTTVPVVDFDGLQKKYPELEKPPETALDTRPSITGRVPQGTPYGNWLLQQDKKLQVKTLGNEGKVNFFKKLAKREGSGQAALRKMIRTDGSERSLKDLERLYGKPSAIKPKPKPVTKPAITITNQDKLDDLVKAAKAAERKTPSLGKTSPVFGTDTLEEYLKSNNIAKSTQQFVDESIDSLESVGGLTGKHTKKLRKFLQKSKTINNFNFGGDQYNFNAAYQKFVVQNKKAFDDANNTTIRFMDKFNTPFTRKTKGYANTVTTNFKKKNVKDLQFKDDIKFMFAPAGRTCSGYTSNYCTIVNTEVKKGAKKITPTSAKMMKIQAKRVLKTNKEYADYWSKGDYSLPSPAREIFSNSSVMDVQEKWFSTMIHEIGHQVHYKGSGAVALGNKFKKMGGMSYVTGYSRKNPRELFAESFVQYVLNPEEMQKIAPRLYNWVEEITDNALNLL